MSRPGQESLVSVLDVGRLIPIFNVLGPVHRKPLLALQLKLLKDLGYKVEVHEEDHDRQALALSLRAGTAAVALPPPAPAEAPKPAPAKAAAAPAKAEPVKASAPAPEPEPSEPEPEQAEPPSLEDLTALRAELEAMTAAKDIAAFPANYGIEVPADVKAKDLKAYLASVLDEYVAAATPAAE